MKNVSDLNFWEDIYKKNDIGWDLNGPTPIFKQVAKKLKPGKIIILGCGRGHDAITFARLGFEVTAVDFAPSAIKYLTNLCNHNRLEANIIQNDIFLLDESFNSYFDYVIEQTCFCAIDPKRRKEYEKLVYRLLNCSGRLIGVWYLLSKVNADGGPPWGVSIPSLKETFKEDWIIIEESFSNLSVERRRHREKLIIFQKKQQSK